MRATCPRCKGSSHTQSGIAVHLIWLREHYADHHGMWLDTPTLRAMLHRAPN